MNKNWCLLSLIKSYNNLTASSISYEYRKNKNVNAAQFFCNSLWIYNFVHNGGITWHHSKHETHLTPPGVRWDFLAPEKTAEYKNFISWLYFSQLWVWIPPETYLLLFQGIEKEAIQLAYGTSLVLLKCLARAWKTYTEGYLRFFSTSKVGKSAYNLYNVSATLNPIQNILWVGYRIWTFCYSK